MAPNAHPGKPLLDGSPGLSLYRAVIVKTVDAQNAPRGGFTTCRGTRKLPFPSTGPKFPTDEWLL
jgi:hypothetical protein